MKFEELVKELREMERICCDRMDGEVMLQAANAIEELQAAVSGFEANTDVAFVKENGHEYIRFVPKWIPVTERLPEQGKRYLVIRFDGVTKTLFVDILWHDAHGLWWNRLYKGHYNVTHWMPLPEPPKESTVYESIKTGLEQAISGEYREETAPKEEKHE